MEKIQISGWSWSLNLWRMTWRSAPHNKRSSRQSLGGSKNRGKPATWMVKIMENPIFFIDDLGVPLFSETAIKLRVWCNLASICLTKKLTKIWWNTGAVLLFGCLAALELQADSKLFGFLKCNDGDRNKHATSVKGSNHRLVYSQITRVPGTIGAVGKQLRLKRNTAEKLKKKTRF